VWVEGRRLPPFLKFVKFPAKFENEIGGTFNEGDRSVAVVGNPNVCPGILHINHASIAHDRSTLDIRSEKKAPDAVW
jgi:hypothetical protein